MKLCDKVFYFIAGHGRGWAFSSSDLVHKFTRQEIDNTLSDLTQKGKIRRVARGIYDYPKYSELLEKELSPDIEQVAFAYARKHTGTKVNLCRRDIQGTITIWRSWQRQMLEMKLYLI